MNKTDTIKLGSIMRDPTIPRLTFTEAVALLPSGPIVKTEHLVEDKGIDHTYWNRNDLLHQMVLANDRYDEGEAACGIWETHPKCREHGFGFRVRAASDGPVYFVLTDPYVESGEPR